MATMLVCGIAATVVAMTAMPSAAGAESRDPAKLSVARGTVDRSGSRLDVLAPITKHASGGVSVEFYAAGRRYRFEADVNPSKGWVRFRQPIPSEQARKGTGIVTIAYPGNSRTRSQEVRLRAASRRAALDAKRPALTPAGSGLRLSSAGTLSKRARGVVRVQLDWVDAEGASNSHQSTARITDGKWSLSEDLPTAVAQSIKTRTSTVHSYTLFTGYERVRMRGEMKAYQVLNVNGAAPAAAAPVNLLHRSISVGGTATFDVQPDGTQTCAARLSRNDKNLRFANIPLTRDDGVVSQTAIRVVTSEATRPGLYSVSVSCSLASQTTMTVRVRHTTTSRSVGQRSPSMLFMVTAVRPFTIEELRVRAAQAWAQDGPAILAGYRNGQCTDWAAQKRPDLVQRVEEANYIALYQQRPAQFLADARTWASVAAESGLMVQDIPTAGSLVVWQPEVEGADGDTGHVGYVESVSADGSTFATSEMNFGSPYTLGYRNLSSVPVLGRQFILP